MEEKVIAEISKCEDCPLFRRYQSPFMECKYYSGKPWCGFPVGHSPSRKPAFCKITTLKAVFE